jgi:hypothetical protein
MKHRFVVIVAILSLTAVFAPAQSKTSRPLRTPDGHPDLEGIWSFATITPMERPANLAGKEYFTEQEAVEYEKQARERNDKDRRPANAQADVGAAYNDFWWDPGTKVVKTRRTSLVIDPPDGRIPALTAEARQRQAQRQAAAAASRAHEFDGPENRPLAERCLKLQGAGPPITPTAYNNNTKIVQGKDYVALWVEMGHEVRVIPLDGRPHLPANIRTWNGDSVGHWEGEWLVVETTNFLEQAAYRGGSPNMKLIERFKRLDADTLIYQFTIDDPATYVKPWTAEIPLTRSNGIYEYACHEGNHGMAGALAGARAEEKRGQ